MNDVKNNPSPNSQVSTSENEQLNKGVFFWNSKIAQSGHDLLKYIDDDPFPHEKTPSASINTRDIQVSTSNQINGASTDLDNITLTSEQVEHILKWSKEGGVKGTPIEKLNDELYFAEIEVVDQKKGGVEGGAIVKLLDGKKYMLKGLYEQNGKYLAKPNATNQITKWWTKQELSQINRQVIREFAALKLANVVCKDIAPETHLVKIEHKGENSENLIQYALLSEYMGQNDGEKFSDLEHYLKEKDEEGIQDQLEKIPLEKWKSEYEITVLLLNDSDANKLDNIGVITNKNNEARLCLFDLGHISPNKFGLHYTLEALPASFMAEVALRVLNAFGAGLNGIMHKTFTMDENIQSRLSVKDRADAVKHLLDNKIGEIETCISDIEKQLPENAKEVIKELKEEIDNRIDYLKNLREDVDDPEDYDRKVRKRMLMDKITYATPMF